jgi:hypothetical protein
MFKRWASEGSVKQNSILQLQIAQGRVVNFGLAETQVVP